MKSYSAPIIFSLACAFLITVIMFFVPTEIYIIDCDASNDPLYDCLHQQYVEYGYPFKQRYDDIIFSEGLSFYFFSEKPVYVTSEYAVNDEVRIDAAYFNFGFYSVLMFAPFFLTYYLINKRK